MQPASLSVIIPALNEAAHLGDTLESVMRGGPDEVVVVDGGSADLTREIADAHGARVVVSETGRARQMNAGASVAAGAHLMFLHADTVPPAGYVGHVSETLARPEAVAGAFRLRIDGACRRLRLVERAVDWRSRVRQMPYGDQGLFVPANTFRGVGGFEDLPVMEDYELVRRLRRLGRIEIVDAAALTSRRRWHERGVWRTTLLNQACIAAYRLGVAPERIARWRVSSYRSGRTGRRSPRPPAVRA